MTPDQFPGHCFNNIAEVELSFFLSHAGVIDSLKKQIAQFELEFIHVATIDGVSDFIGFLDRKGRDRFEVLLKIPRATGYRRAQGNHDFKKPGDITGRGHSCQIAEPKDFDYKPQHLPTMAKANCIRYIMERI
jgi:hypothetical protein